jgi:hypothetical protein
MVFNAPQSPNLNPIDYCDMSLVSLKHKQRRYMEELAANVSDTGVRWLLKSANTLPEVCQEKLMLF